MKTQAIGREKVLGHRAHYNMGTWAEELKTSFSKTCGKQDNSQMLNIYITAELQIKSILSC